MNRVHTLSDKEAKALKRLHRQTNSADVRSRCDMTLLSNEGLSPPQIAKRVRFSRYTVVRFIQRYEAEGLQGLYTKPHSGRPRRVTPEYEAKLLAAVEKEPRLLEKHENRIQLEWLPSYSPELNAQEDVWQHVRRRVTHNHYFEHMDALLEAVQQFHHQLESEPKQVLRLLKKWAKLIST